MAMTLAQIEAEYHNHVSTEDHFTGEVTLEEVNLLYELAALLRTISNRSFDLSVWANAKGQTDEEIDAFYDMKELHHCKTVGCIAGWATNVHKDLVLNNGDVEWLDPSLRSKKVYPPSGTGAFALAYKITWSEANWLTMGNHGKGTSKECAKCVEWLADQYAKQLDLDVTKEQCTFAL